MLTEDAETRNTWHRPDPSFTYLLSFFLVLTALAWGLAYADGVSRTINILLVFVFGHFLATSLLISTAMYALVGKFLSPQGAAGLPGRSRRQGLFGPPGSVSGEQLEFGYCFDVSLDGDEGCISAGTWIADDSSCCRFRYGRSFPSGSFFTSFNSCSCPSYRAITGYRSSLAIRCIS